MVARTDLEWKARLYDLEGEVRELLREGKRDPEMVAMVLQEIKNGRNFLARLGLESVSRLGRAEEQLARLRPLYRELFDFDFNPAEIKVPEVPTGFNRLIVGNETDLRPNRIVTGLRKKMKVETYGVDLDKETLRASYIKRPKGTYAVCVRESQEADNDMKNRSIRDLEREGVNCLMLPERLSYEAIFHAETGLHLDVKSVTLCAGSRNRDGLVPDVSWDAEDVKVYVNWAGPEYCDPSLRARVAVS